MQQLADEQNPANYGRWIRTVLPGLVERNQSEKQETWLPMFTSDTGGDTGSATQCVTDTWDTPNLNVTVIANWRNTTNSTAQLESIRIGNHTGSPFEVIRMRDDQTLVEDHGDAVNIPANGETTLRFEPSDENSDGVDDYLFEFDNQGNEREPFKIFFENQTGDGPCTYAVTTWVQMERQ